MAGWLMFCAVAPSFATPGVVQIDGRLASDSDGAQHPVTWIVSAAAAVRIESIEAPAVLLQGERGVPVSVRVANRGSLDSPLTGARLSPGALERAVDFTISTTGSIPTRLGPGEERELHFLLDVSSLAATGPLTLQAFVDQAPSGAREPPELLVSRTNLCPVARAGFNRSVVVTSTFTEVPFRLTGHDSIDPDRPDSDPARPSLRFSWALLEARSESGAPLMSVTPFERGSRAALEGSGDPDVVDPIVLLRAPGRYRFGLTVAETGVPDPGNTGCVSSEARVTLLVRRLLPASNTPPSVQASIVDPVSGALVESLPAEFDPAGVRVTLTAVPASGGSFDRETPRGLLRFQWVQLFDLPFGPTPGASIEASFTASPTVKLVAPGMYAFAVAVLDDGRPSAGAPPAREGVLGSLLSNAVTVLVRPRGNTFPVVTSAVATAQGSTSPLSFSNPAVIPAAASNTAGGFPVVLLEATASDAETPGERLTYSWHQLPTPEAPPSAVLVPLAGNQARFIPGASGTYRFAVTVEDGELSARAVVTVPVDDLRPGGRTGVSPVVNEIASSGDELRYEALSGSSFTLDASKSSDRAALHGRPGAPLTFFWTQHEGPSLLGFTPSNGTLRLDLPRDASGEFAITLELDNGDDALSQRVRITARQAPVTVVGRPAAGFSGAVTSGGGCALRGYSTAASWPDLPILLALLLWLALRRGRKVTGSRAA